MLGGARTIKQRQAGTHRAVELEATWARVRPLLERIGVTRVANVTGLDVVGVPVIAVHRPNSRSLSVSFGKGASLLAARVSGAMEALESFCAERVNRNLRHASFRELQESERVVDVARLPRLSTSMLHPDLPLLWVEGRELETDSVLWVPYELVHTDFRIPLPTGSGCFAMTSNGLASGNRPIEAAIHGMCEVIERDATTLFHSLGPEQQSERRLDLASVDDPVSLQVIEAIQRAGLLLGVWDTTTDLGVPSFLATVLEKGPCTSGAVGPISGMGCHTVREVALSRALTEVAQGRLTVISGARDDLALSRYEQRADAERWARVAQRLSDKRAAKSFQSCASFEAETFEDDLEWLLARFRGASLPSVVAIELTVPRLDVSVVRVVAPGLEFMHDMTGYAPGERARRLLSQRVGPSPSSRLAEGSLR